jgi:hypothetical protein
LYNSSILTLHSFCFDVQSLYNQHEVKEFCLLCNGYTTFGFLSINNTPYYLTCFIRTPSIKLYTDATDTPPIYSCVLV